MASFNFNVFVFRLTMRLCKTESKFRSVDKTFSYDQYLSFNTQTINAPYDTKQKDNIEYNEYRGDEVHDKIYRSILKQTYRMFRLFCGSFQNHIPTGQGYSVVPQELIDKLKEFYFEVGTTSFDCNRIVGI